MASLVRQRMLGSTQQPQAVAPIWLPAQEACSTSGRFPPQPAASRLSNVSCRVIRPSPARPFRSRSKTVPQASAQPQSQAEQLNVSQALSAFYKFTRPHTMAGTIVSIVSISLLAMQQGPSGSVFSPEASSALASALASALLANIAIVGLNQLFDVEIDRINKPYLPLASGEFSMAVGTWIVGVCTVLSVTVAWAANSPPLLATVVGSLILGVLYSTELPFMRWKRSPVLAASCILAVRAVMVQLGFYFHMALALAGGSAAALAAPPTSAVTALAGLHIGGLAVTPALAFTVGFMVFYSIVIALFKDIPDVKGDDRAGVRTLSVRIGVDRVFWACIALLVAAYGTSCAYSLARAAATGWAGPALVKAAVNCAGSTALAATLWFSAHRVNTKKKSDLTDYYMLIWKAFYLSYGLVPFLA